MLMVVDNGICSSIDKEAIGFNHSRRRQLEHFVSTMYYYKHMVSLILSFLNSIILTYGIKRVGAS